MDVEEYSEQETFFVSKTVFENLQNVFSGRGRGLPYESLPYVRGSQTFLVTEPFHIISKVVEPLFNSNENKGKLSYSYQQLPLLALFQLRICRTP